MMPPHAAAKAVIDLLEKYTRVGYRHLTTEELLNKYNQDMVEVYLPIGELIALACTYRDNDD